MAPRDDDLANPEAVPGDEGRTTRTGLVTEVDSGRELMHLDVPPVGEALVGEELPAVSGLPEGGQATARGSVLRLTALTFIENRLAIWGLGILVFMALFCFVGPLIYHTNQTTLNPAFSNYGPSLAHPLGTDNEGFDVLGRLMVGGQSSLEIGLAVGVVAVIFGSLYGAIAAVAGGAVDAVMMRIVDGLFSIPTLFLLIILGDIYTPNVPLLIIVLSLLSWLGTARLVRGEALSLRTREFVQAVKVAGGSQRRVVVRHLIPNTIGTIMVTASFIVADSILVLATLGFLGFGLPSPAADWGQMLSNGVTYLFDGYWWQLYPAGIAIVLTVVAFNLIGDALRDSLDARLQRR
jgi:peptide/nickel transport system permease protein